MLKIVLGAKKRFTYIYAAVQVLAHISPSRYIKTILATIQTCFENGPLMYIC